MNRLIFGSLTRFRALVGVAASVAALAFLTTCTNPTWIEATRYSAPAAVRPQTYDPELQWNMEMINAPGAWAILEQLEAEGRLSPVVVAVLDTQVAEHEHLSHSLIEVIDIVGDGQGGQFGPGISNNQHGTHVAGAIASSNTGHETGTEGVAHVSGHILSVRVLDNDGYGTTLQVTRGIEEATSWTGEVNGAAAAVRVINLSLGGSATDPHLFAAIEAAVAQGITVVAASGNSNAEGMLVPAFYDNTLAVGAVSNSGLRAPYSNYGRGLTFAAPGGIGDSGSHSNGVKDAVLSTVGDNTAYYWLSGTSMATPHVAGVAALLYSVQPGLNQDAVYSILRSTARDLGTAGWDRYYGHGLVDAQAALEYLLQLERRIPRVPMGEEPGGSRGISIATDTLSGAQFPQPDADIEEQSLILRLHDAAIPAIDADEYAFETLLRQQFGIDSARRVGRNLLVVQLAKGQQVLELLGPMGDLDEVQYSQPNYRYQAIR